MRGSCELTPMILHSEKAAAVIQRYIIYMRAVCQFANIFKNPGSIPRFFNI